MTLPKRWERRTLSELVLPVDTVKPVERPTEGFVYIDISSIDRQGRRIVKPQPLVGSEAPSRARQQVRRGDVLVSTVRPNLRAIARVPEELDGQVASTGFCVLRPSANIRSDYLFYAVCDEDFQRRIGVKARGVSYPAVRPVDILEEEINLPPVDEQEAIVRKVARLDAQWGSAKADLEDAARFVREARRSIYALADRDEDDEVEVGDLIERIEAGKSLSGEGRPATEAEWGVVKVSAMTWGAFDPHENKVLVDQSAADPRNEIRPGDLLLSRANTTELVGASVLVPADVRGKLLLSDKSLRLVPKGGVKAAWLQAALNAPRVRSQISAQATGTSDSMRNISQAKLRQVRLHVPSSVEQTVTIGALTEHLEELSVLEEDLRTTSRDAEHLRSSILRAATTGRLLAVSRSAESVGAYL